MTYSQEVNLYSKEISIQISLNGYSFCVVDTNDKYELEKRVISGFNFDALLPWLNDSRIHLWWNTTKVILMPAASFNPLKIDSYLNAMNIGYGEPFYDCSPVSDVVLLWRSEKRLYESFLSIIPPTTSHITNHHPLFKLVGENVQKHIMIETIGGIAHIAVYREPRQLVAGLSVKIQTTSDLIYYLKKITTPDTLEHSYIRYKISLRTDNSEIDTALLRQYFEVETF